MVSQRNFLPLLALMLLAVGLLVACATNPVSGKSEFVMMSEAQEIDLGHQEHPNILKRYGRYENAQLQAYVERVGQQLAGKSHRSKLTFTFTLLDSEEVNAFALPGGYVYITRGLLAYLNNEAELAAVLGHEIGHVTARHGVRQMSTAGATQLGINLGALLVPELRSQAAQDLVNVLGTAFVRGYGREHELEADRLGAEYLARVGYDPRAMIDVIGVLKNQELFESARAKEEGREPQVYHGVFATHPDNDQRLQETVAAADRLKDRPVTLLADRTSFVRAQDQLVYGPSERDGVVRGNRFYHAALDIAIDFPQEWAIDNQAERLLAMAPKGEALLQVTMEEAKGQSPSEFLAARFKQSLRQGSELPVAGLSGYSGLVAVDTRMGKRDGRASVVYHQTHAFVFVGVAKQPDKFGTFDSHFLATARSLHSLTRAERKLAQAARLTVVAVKSGDTLAALAKQSTMKQHAEALLRLLNGYYPGGEPPPGTLVKIIQ